MLEIIATRDKTKSPVEGPAFSTIGICMVGMAIVCPAVEDGGRPLIVEPVETGAAACVFMAGTVADSATGAAAGAAAGRLIVEGVGGADIFCVGALVSAAFAPAVGAAGLETADGAAGAGGFGAEEGSGAAGFAAPKTGPLPIMGGGGGGMGVVRLC